uniref:G_PROTEIN_RECEP_F1_2 domain-containing protein n=1 Tax=Steinernema glaseri TaxID=37863 RepID=A0A1I7YTI8_9BILA
MSSASENASTNSTRLVVGNLFPNNPPLQIVVSTINLVNIAFVLFVSFKIGRSDLSRLYTLWLYFVAAPGDVLQIIISVLQIFGVVDSSGNYYRDYHDWVQITGKLAVDISGSVYRVLCLLMLIATFMSYTFPFAFQKVFHQKYVNSIPCVWFCLVPGMDEAYGIEMDPRENGSRDNRSWGEWILGRWIPPKELDVFWDPLSQRSIVQLPSNYLVASSGVNPWRRNALYLGGVLFCVAQILYNNVQTIVTILFPLPEDITTVWYLSVQGIIATITFLNILFYFLAISVILLYGRKQTNAGNTRSTHRRQLLSVIVYATMPNVLIVLSQIANGFMIAIAALPLEVRTADNPLITTSSTFIRAARYAGYARVPILTISTFVAFTPYRRALMALIPARVPILTISTFVAFTPYRRALMALIPVRFKVIQVLSIEQAAPTQTNSVSSPQFPNARGYQ